MRRIPNLRLDIEHAEDALKVRVRRHQIDMHTCQRGCRRIQLLQRRHESDESAKRLLLSLNDEVTSDRERERRSYGFEKACHYRKPPPSERLLQGHIHKLRALRLQAPCFEGFRAKQADEIGSGERQRLAENTCKFGQFGLGLPAKLLLR